MDAANNSPPRPNTEKQTYTNQQEAAGDNGHNRSYTPFESPTRASSSRPPIPSTPGDTHTFLHPPSTPAQNLHGFAPGTPNHYFTTHSNPHGSSRIISELNTPVISNANVTYVDDDHDGMREGHSRRGLPPTQLGLVGGRSTGRAGNPDIPFGDNKSTSYGVPLSKSLAPRTNSNGRLLGARPPQPFATKGSPVGMGMMTSLAVPSALHSDDSSLEDDTINHAAFPASLGSAAAQESILHPIELKPNRFHSFQGSAQYQRSIPGRNVHFVNAGPGNENGSSRRTTNLSPAREYPYPTTTHVANTSTGQYFPTVRGAHGVRELSDTKDLDAIFKADRTTADTISGHPSSIARSAKSSMNPKIVSPMSVDDNDRDEDDDGEEEQRQESSSFHQLGGAIPIDDRQWSIPSIRLANHVTASGLDGSFTSYHTLFSDDEDYTDDGGSSFDGSFLGCEDDDVSLSSKESYDQVKRWRRLSGVLRRGSAIPPAAVLTGDDQDVAMMPPPHVMRTAPTRTSDLDVPDAAPMGALGGVSLLEQRFGQIAIKESTSISASPPILDANTPLQSIDDNIVDYHGDTTDGAVGARGAAHRRRRHKKKGRSSSHSAAALEWIQNLQQSNVVEGSRITEAASSKFLTGVVKKVEPLDLAVLQDATKALGMPHPLCRSTTIEAGGFAYDLGGGRVESAMVLMDDGE
ncbi:hypothetical protein ACHAW6_006240 [Cyclotella cf. meneghiniana]